MNLKAMFILWLLPALSMAANLEIGIGQSSYTIRSDGTWYQLGNSHAIDRRSPAYQIGLTGNLWDGKVGADWHVDYVNLGHLRSTCDCTTLDSLYDMRAHRMLVPPPYPTARYVGSGVADGIKLSLSPYVRLGDWKVGAEGGLFPYRPRWDMTVYHWATNLEGPFVNGTHNTPRSIQWGGVYGFFVQRGNFTVSYESYWLKNRFDNAHPPALWQGDHVVMVNYNF